MAALHRIARREHRDAHFRSVRAAQGVADEVRLHGRSRRGRSQKTSGGRPMKIAIAGDHAGFGLKQVLVADLRADGHDVSDFGACDTTPSDYPDFAELVRSEEHTSE